MPPHSTVRWWQLTFGSTWCLSEAPSLDLELECSAPITQLLPDPALASGLVLVVVWDLAHDLEVHIVNSELVFIQILKFSIAFA